MMRPTSNQRYKETRARMTRAGKMKPKTKKYLAWTIAGVVILIVVLVLAMNWAAIMAALGLGAVAPTTYSIKVSDGILNVDLDGDYFDYSLYGTNGTDWADFELVETGSGISGIVAADLDLSDYKEYWVLVDGVHPHDDDIYGDAEGDDIGDRVYGERWYKLNPSGANNIIMYQTPDPVFISVIDSTDGSAISNLTAGELPVGTNVTVIVGMNSTQESAAYVPYFDPVSGETIQFTILVTFDNSTVKGDFMLAGSSGSFVDTANQDDLEFVIGSLLPGTLTLTGKWSGATVDGDETQISQIDLMWGSTVLATLA